MVRRSHYNICFPVRNQINHGQKIRGSIRGCRIEGTYDFRCARRSKSGPEDFAKATIAPVSNYLPRRTLGYGARKKLDCSIGAAVIHEQIEGHEAIS
jgi:hypothetical protein